MVNESEAQNVLLMPEVHTPAGLTPHKSEAHTPEVQKSEVHKREGHTPRMRIQGDDQSQRLRSVFPTLAGSGSEFEKLREEIFGSGMVYVCLLTLAYMGLGAMDYRVREPGWVECRVLFWCKG